MSPKHNALQDPDERGTEIALFRYGLIAPLLFGSLSAGELEKALREIAAKSYAIPHSTRTRVGMTTLRRYLKLYQKDGFDALRPPQRSDRRKPRVFLPRVLEKAVALREEQPERTTPMIVQLLKRDPDLAGIDLPNPHTLATHLRERGKTRKLLSQNGRTFKHFERNHSNDLWQGDAMDGPWLPDPTVAGKKRRAYLFCFLDDHSRLVPYAQFFFDEALPRMERVLKVGILRRGVPLAIYVDNGRVYASNQFGAACASLGIERIHAAPYSPEGKGKQERFFRTVRLQFMPEVETSGLTTLAELNESFWAWLECIYHRTVHSETGQTPLERFQQDLQNLRSADPEQLACAFLWRETRQVRKGGMLDLQGNRYQAPGQLAGRKIQLRFDPFDLSNLQIWLDGQFVGDARVVQQNRQRHLQVERLQSETPQPSKPASSLDYLALLRAEYQTLQQKQAGSLHYTRLPQEKK
jgi:putative transposase